MAKINLEWGLALNKGLTFMWQNQGSFFVKFQADMRAYLSFIFFALYLCGCLQPMKGPEAEKVDRQVQCGFGSSGC